MKLTRRSVLGGLSTFGLAGCRTAELEPSREATAKAAPAPEARSVTRVVPGTRTMEGAGVRLTRTLGSRALDRLDPFLLLDDIHSQDPRDYQAGFPTHPHRGFETVTYVIEGVIEHGDSLGNRGVLTGGSLQWMTAGKGIVHSEMPKVSGGPLWGLQLWVNLPKRLKMTAPRYQDIARERVPELGKTRVLAGDRDGTKGAVSGIATAPSMLDATVTKGERLVHPLPAGHTAFLYVLSGTALVGPDKRAVNERDLAVLGEGTAVHVTAGDVPARVLLVAAAPIGEPVARRGPFVMNTEDELDQAVDDYRNGRLTSG